MSLLKTAELISNAQDSEATMNEPFTFHKLSGLNQCGSLAAINLSFVKITMLNAPSIFCKASLIWST